MGGHGNRIRFLGGVVGDNVLFAVFVVAGDAEPTGAVDGLVIVVVVGC